MMGDIGVRGMKRAMLTSLEERFTDIEEIDFFVLGILLLYCSYSTAKCEQCYIIHL